MEHVYLCSCSLNRSCLPVSECCIDSLGTHLCPIMEQSSCAVTSIRRAARPYLLIHRLQKKKKKTWQTSPALVGIFFLSFFFSNIGRSHGPITGAGCYQKISVSEGRFSRVLWYSQIWSCSELWKAGIWRNGLYLCLGKLEPSPEMTPSFLFAAEAN